MGKPYGDAPAPKGGGKMPKQGVLHDYDLHANHEKSAQLQRCIVCDDYPMRFQWSDYSGEGMCMQCGCPYQLKWGSDERQKEGHYPYLNLTDDYIPVAKEYWDETQKFVCYGRMMGLKPGMDLWIAWLKQKHPEFIKEEDE